MGAEAGDRALETARCCTRKTCKLSGDSIPDLPESKPDCQDCDETGNCSKHTPLDPEAKPDTWEERLAWKIASYLDEFPYVLPENIAHIAALIQCAMNAQDEATETRWQNAIYELCKKMVGPKNDHLIDGGGCDSGDALDFTLAEIGQAIGFWQDEADAMNAQERELREALRRYADEHTRSLSSGTGKITVCTCRLCNLTLAERGGTK